MASKETRRKCAKCGITAAEDANLVLHRFPRPGKYGAMRARVWAKYCFPNEDWTSEEALFKLHSLHRMICSNHFNESAYTSSAKNRLNNFAIPAGANDIFLALHEESKHISNNPELFSCEEQTMTVSKDIKTLQQEPVVTCSSSVYQQFDASNIMKTPKLEDANEDSSIPENNSSQFPVNSSYTSTSPSPPVSNNPLHVPTTSSQDVLAGPSLDMIDDHSPDMPAGPSLDIPTYKSTHSEKNPVPQQSNKKVIKVLKLIKKQSLSNQEIEDEFYYFGKNIASQLRQLPISDALDVQAEMLNLLRKKRQSILQRFEQSNSSNQLSNSKYYTIEKQENVIIGSEQKIVIQYFPK